MYRSCLPLVLILGISLTNAKHLPSYITACRKDDPHLNECAAESARKAIPSILKGDKDFKIPSFLPFHFPSVEVHPSNDILFKLKNITLRGLDTIQIKDMNIDLEKRFISLNADLMQTIVDSDYEVSGKLLSFQLQGAGPAHIVSDNVTIGYSFTYDLVKRKGKDFIDISSIKATMTYGSENVHYKFDNLFGENQLLTDNFNKFLNENAKEVDSIAGATNREVVNGIVFEVFKVLFRVVPYEEIFL